MNLEDPGRVRNEGSLQLSLGFIEPSRGESLAAELKRILREKREKRDEGEHHRESTGTGGAPRRIAYARPARSPS